MSVGDDIIQFMKDHPWSGVSYCPTHGMENWEIFDAESGDTFAVGETPEEALHHARIELSERTGSE